MDKFHRPPNINIMKNSSGRLYRIVSFHHVVQIFEQRELFFSHPSTWEDPYETRLVHRDAHKIFAQCWCSDGTSDAMWRIYSPNHLGIRIGTSTKKLRMALSNEAITRELKIRMQDVAYYSQYNLNKKAESISEELRQKFDLEKASDLLFMKRNAYEHESEYRVVILDNKRSAEDFSNGLKIHIDPKKLIDSILIDPRAPRELADALIWYFQNKLGFSKKCQQSVLYKTPKPLIVED